MYELSETFDRKSGTHAVNWSPDTGYVHKNIRNETWNSVQGVFDDPNIQEDFKAQIKAAIIRFHDKNMREILARYKYALSKAQHALNNPPQ